MYTKIYKKNAYRHKKLGKDCSYTFCYVPNIHNGKNMCVCYVIPWFVKLYIQ